MILFGPDLTELREHAKAAVMRRFVDLASQDGVPPTLRAMYVRKAEQAQLVVSGGESALIAGEAALRGVTPMELAQTVLAMAAAGGDEAEVQRMAVNVQIEQAPSEADIMAVLERFGISLGIGGQQS